MRGLGGDRVVAGDWAGIEERLILGGRGELIGELISRESGSKSVYRFEDRIHCVLVR